jgi:hypothetical protein
MNERHLPTEQERVGIGRITAWRSRLPFLVLVPMALLVGGQLLADDGGWPLVIIAGALLLIMLSVVVHVSFFLRCPRCSTWVGVAVPKCASCGLKFEGPKPSQASTVAK